MKIISYISWVLICLFSTGSQAQNAPVTTAGSVTSYGSKTTVAVTAANFTNIGSCNLKLTYNPAILTATAVTTGALPGGNVNSNLAVPGEISLGWYTFPAVTLPDHSVIFNIDFTVVTSGTSLLAWVDDGASCQYTDGNYNNLNDIPQSDYYADGSVLAFLLSAPAGTIAGEAGRTAHNPLKMSAYPDPFTGQAAFTFVLPERGHVVLDLMNMQGEKVASTAGEDLTGGEHSLKMTLDHLRPGIYMAVLSLKTNHKLIVSSLKIIRR